MSRFRSVQVDEAVVVRLVSGDRDAQEAVYRAFADAVYTLAKRVLNDAALAEEATQDTFVDVIEGVAKLENPSSLATWIRAIAVNQCLMRLRSPWHKRRQCWEEERLASTGAASARVASDGDGVDRALDVELALERLPADARLVVWMHCVEGYTHEEIGTAFGRTASFSKSKLARALRALSSNQPKTRQTAGRQRAPRRGNHESATATIAACAS